MSIDVKAGLDAVITELTLIDKFLPNKPIEEAIAVAKWVESNQPLMDLIQSLVDQYGPDAAKHVDLNHPALQSVLDEHKAATGAKAISIIDIANLLQYLPVIIQLIQQFLKPKPAPTT